MPDKWMSVAAAAAAMNVHTRTIERRMASNKIESRRTDDGQLQVLVNVPDEVPASPVMSADAQTEAFETVKELAQDQVSLATGSASALVKFAQADAERARTELDLVRRDAGHARRSATFAWAAVAVMAATICVAVGWTSHKITRTDDDIRAMNDHAAAIEADARQMRTERDTALADAENAKLASATAAGHLEAIMQLPTTRPTTRPANFVQKLAATFFEP
jgi:hypothetical protein